MNKTDLLEIRKRFKKEGNSLSRMGCFIVSSEEEGIRDSKVTQFLLLEDKEQHKYLEIAAKALSSGHGSLTQDTEGSEELRKLLGGIVSSKMENEELMNVLTDEIRRHYDYHGNYALIIFLDDYDVPVKTSDKRSLDESEEVYSYMLCCICPIRPSGAGLAYYPEEETVVRCMDIMQAIQKPAAAFVYPSFEERSSDIDHIFCNSKEKEGQALLVDLFGCEPYVEEKKPPKQTAPAVMQQPVLTEAANPVMADDDGADYVPASISIEAEMSQDGIEMSQGGMQMAADDMQISADGMQMAPAQNPDQVIDGISVQQGNGEMQQRPSASGYVADPEEGALTKPSDLFQGEEEDTEIPEPKAGEVIPVGMKQFEIKNIDGKDCFVIPTGFVNIQDIIRLLKQQM